MKTNELTGRALAYAVGIAEGYKVEYRHTKYVAILSAGIPRGVPWNPHTDWSQGGPIIEREAIGLCPDEYIIGNDRWCAVMTNGVGYASFGPTPLIAAMRCYCCAKLGEFVDIPEELCQQESN